MPKIELDELAGPDGAEEGTRLAQHWLDQLHTITDQAEYKRWLKRGADIEKRYRDERNRTDEEGQRRYNALWSNIEILKPALYGKCPLPIAERRFKDKDPIGRAAAEMLERSLRNEIEICGFDEAIAQAVSDYLLPGRGTVWVRYEPEIEESVSLPLVTETDIRDSQGNILTGKDAEGYGQHGSDDKDKENDNESTVDKPRRRVKIGEEGDSTPQTEEPEEGPEDEKELEEEKMIDTGDRIIRESVPIDFVPWVDFFTLPVKARTWREVTAVAKRVYMSRNQLIKRFGKTIGKAIPVQKDDRGQKTQFTTLQSIGNEDKGQIFEIWDRDTESVYWVAEGYTHLCDRKEDPLELENFFPCPKPLYANPTNTTLIPVPDYIQYQDQAIQIDELTQRIAMITKCMKVAGLYNAAAKDVQRLLNESVENELIPVDDWAAFAEEGGIEGNISLLPIKDIMMVLNELMMAKAKQIEEMDRLTGINDIMRGTTDARETLGAQRLKSNNTGTRLTHRQNEVARFARDTIRIMADIMCQHFSPQSIIETSGALYEEGLGPDDMPPLSELIKQGATPSPSPGLPPPSQGQPGQPPQLPPPGQGQLQGQPIQPGGGGNVVPFPPRPAPPSGMPGGAPGSQATPPPVSQPGLPPGPPPIPWQIQAKIDAVKRISDGLKLLRNERMRGFRVDIEVDSTIYPDAQQEKQDRAQFIAGVTQFLQQAMMLGGAMPTAIPLMGKLLQFGVRGYRVGRDLELAIEQFSEAAVVEVQQKLAAASQTPTPEQQKIDIEKAKAQSQIAMQQGQMKNEQVRAAADVHTEQIKAQSQREQGQAEVARQREENEGEKQNLQMEMQRNQHKAQTDMAKTQADTQAEVASHQMDMRMKQMEVAIEMMKMQLMQNKLTRDNMQPFAPAKEEGSGQ